MNIINLRKQMFYRSLNRGYKETELLLYNFAIKNLENMNEYELLEYGKLLDMNDCDLYKSFFFHNCVKNSFVQKIIAFNNDLI